MYDVVIVGARLAGSATGLLLARSGLDVLIIDQARFPSDTLSTHQLQVPGGARLARLGLLEKVIAAGTPPSTHARFDTAAGIKVEGRFPTVDGVSAVYSPRRTILDNLLEAARVRPIVIQSLWMHVRGEPPEPAEIDAFAHRIKDILDSGGRIKLVQIYTIARRTTEPWVTPLSDAQLDQIAEHVQQISAAPTAVFGS